MRKSRTVIEFEKGITFKIDNIFTLLEQWEIPIPNWSLMFFFFAHNSKADISFFEDPQDFFLWYSKVMVIKGDEEIAPFSFTKEGKEWHPFNPPTLIGVNLKTKLR